MSLPSLAHLHSCAAGKDEKKSQLKKGVYYKWIRACTQGTGDTIPEFQAWGGLDSRDKMEFHAFVNKSENDRFSMGQYELPYSGIDIDTSLGADVEEDKWSIEHILPRSRVNGRRPGNAENDWLGWDTATRGMNSTRSNLPLVLWPTPGLPVGRVKIPGDVMHFNPLEEHKDRLARRWIFLRATYAFVDRLAAPSKSQMENANDIIELCLKERPGFAESRLQTFLTDKAQALFGIPWTNPLIKEKTKLLFLGDDEFATLVFGRHVKPVFAAAGSCAAFRAFKPDVKIKFRNHETAQRRP
jgi:hypothetical protein